MRANDPVLVEQGHFALDFKNALNNKHHIRASGVVLVENQRRRVLQGPRQDTLAEFCNLLAVLKDNGVLADKVNAADVAVQVNADAGPIQPCCYLFYMGRFPGAVIALDHDPPVMGKAGQDGQCGVLVKLIGRVYFRDVFLALAEGGDFDIAINTESLAH